MNSFSHYATCTAWETGDAEDCNCHDLPAWRIRKEEGELFPWRIWRRTQDSTYEHLMRCSSFNGAVQLVTGLIWLRNNAIAAKETRDA